MSPASSICREMYRHSRIRGHAHGGSGGDGELEAVSAFLLADGTVDFEWHDPQSDPSWMSADGFLRGAELFVRMMDEDNEITIACEVIQCRTTSTFYIGAVFGYHLGLTLDCDTDRIDSFLLKYDSDIRSGRKIGVDRPEWGVISTRIDCVHVISSMLRTLQLGWKVCFLHGSPERALSVSTNAELNMQVRRLQKRSPLIHED